MGEVSLKFRLPVSRMIYVVMVGFFVATVLCVTGAVVFWTGAIQTSPPMKGNVRSLLVLGVLAISTFVAVLCTVKIIFFNYHELTDRELIVSAFPFHRVRVPLEEIVEIETDAGKINPSFGKTVKYRETGLGKSKGGWSKFYGVSVTHSGGKTVVQSVFGGKNFVLIRAKRHEITTTVPDMKEFVDLVSKAILERKSELKL